MERHRVAIRRLTAVLLVASTALILPSLLEIGASVLFTVGLALVGLVLVTRRQDLARAPTVAGCDLGRYAPDLWLAAFLAAGVLVAFPDATAAELQALGGAVGFAGMANYFLTPVYGFAYSLVAQVNQTLDIA